MQPRHEIPGARQYNQPQNSQSRHSQDQESKQPDVAGASTMINAVVNLSSHEGCENYTTNAGQLLFSLLSALVFKLLDNALDYDFPDL
jgi:hypothetical protein